MIIKRQIPALLNRTSLIFILVCTLILISFLIWGDNEAGMAQQLFALTSNHLRYAALSFILLASDIVLPIPNSIIMYTNGFAFGTLGGAALSILSLMSSAIIGYYLGKLSTQGKWAEPDAKALAFWKKYGVLTILITRGIPVVSESICIVGGHLRMPFSRYLWMNFLGYIPISLVFALLGRYGYDQNAFLFSLACSFGIAGLFWWLGKGLIQE